MSKIRLNEVEMNKVSGGDFIAPDLTQEEVTVGVVPSAAKDVNGSIDIEFYNTIEITPTEFN